MKIDAEIEIIVVPNKSDLRFTKPGDKIIIPIDMDYIDNWDDAISEIENEIWYKYGVSMHYQRDFKILNYNDIYNELHN